MSCEAAQLFTQQDPSSSCTNEAALAAAWDPQVGACIPAGAAGPGRNPHSSPRNQQDCLGMLIAPTGRQLRQISCSFMPDRQCEHSIGAVQQSAANVPRCCMAAHAVLLGKAAGEVAHAAEASAVSNRSCMVVTSYCMACTLSVAALLCSWATAWSCARCARVCGASKCMRQ